MNYASGARYDGKWKEDMKHGRGVDYEEDGTFYEGKFV